jgi:hypothetical protein
VRKIQGKRNLYDYAQWVFLAIAVVALLINAWIANIVAYGLFWYCFFMADLVRAKERIKL